MSHAGTERSLLLMKWDNRVRQLLGSKYPIMLGAYAWHRQIKYGSARLGSWGFGISTAHCFPKPEQLREDMVEGAEQILAKELPERLE
jgi:hypothetical protein